MKILKRQKSDINFVIWYFNERREGRPKGPQPRAKLASLLLHYSIHGWGIKSIDRNIKELIRFYNYSLLLAIGASPFWKGPVPDPWAELIKGTTPQSACRYSPSEWDWAPVFKIKYISYSLFTLWIVSVSMPNLWLILHWFSLWFFLCLCFFFKCYKSIKEFG